MTVHEYEERIRKMENTYGAMSIYVSPDFQCDQTGGFPTSLCSCWEEGRAWLALNESMVDDEIGAEPYRMMCADYGFKPCWDSDDFNRLLESLVEDAIQSAELVEDDDLEMGGM